MVDRALRASFQGHITAVLTFIDMHLPHFFLRLFSLLRGEICHGKGLIFQQL